ncbi:MAG TPA: glycosyltransferase family 2 protein [Propionibacteriaceae bacterium]
MAAPTGSDAGSAREFVPIPTGDLELSHPDQPPPENHLGQAVLLVRLHGTPLGTLNLLDPRADPAPAHDRARSRFAQSVADHLREDGLDPVSIDELLPAPVGPCAATLPPSAHAVSVVICTLGEDPRLVQTVASVFAQTHPVLELLVVDNQPGSGQVSALLAEVEDPRLRIVPEARRGLSVARNTGLAASRGTIVAFTDDDAFADPGWIGALAAPFDRDPSVVCTTGLVLPAELMSPAQVRFEEFGAFDKGFVRTVWSMREPSAAVGALGPRGDGGALFPYSAGVYGSGNNMAFRRDWVGATGLFDEALGAGRPARGGEDLDAFLQVMLSGQVLIYEPRAVVRHYGRSDMAALHAQMYGYGSGLTAALAKQVLAGPRRAAAIAARVPRGLRRLLDPGSDKNADRPSDYPSTLSRSELRGFVAGPFLYAKGRWADRRHRSSRRRSST